MEIVEDSGGSRPHTDLSNYFGYFLIQNNGGEEKQQKKGEVGRGVHSQVKLRRDLERGEGGITRTPFKSPAVKLIPPAFVYLKHSDKGGFRSKQAKL